MPLADPPPYRPPLPFRNPHVNTIVPSLFRTVPDVAYRRERVHTPDQDFLDLDWLTVGARRAAILLHGLEGSAQRGYMRGMARTLARHGWDTVALNFRGCSGEPNRQLRFYHSGDTGDLDLVVQQMLARGYESIVLIGYSLGGNVVLKYLGERGRAVDPRIQAAITFSVPCDLAAGAVQMDRPQNWLYMQRFLRNLHAKIRAKMTQFPGEIDDEDYNRLRSFYDFDGRYTAPLHGFASAEAYWQQCSSRFFLRGIRVPTLLVSAEDDPFLPPACYPVAEAEANPWLRLEIPRYGGHVGFVDRNADDQYWSEARTAAFLAERFG